MNIIRNFKNLNKEFIRFVLVGIINTIFGTTIMFVLYNVFHVDYWRSSGINYFLSSILSFFLNKYFTFVVTFWNIYMIFAFFINIIICYIIAYSLAKQLIHCMLYNYTVSVRDNISMIFGLCLFTVLNYFGQKYLVFRK